MPVTQLEKVPLHTRFAPSPTGYLHLGHMLSCAFIFGIGRSVGARIDLRLEDHDETRSLPKYADAIVEDLHWMGFEFDSQEPFTQSSRSSAYEEYAKQLNIRGSLYYCDCTRSLQKDRGCTTVGGHLIYDNYCRSRNIGAHRSTWRLEFETQDSAIEEFGWHVDNPSYNPLIECGDFPVRDKNGFWTYQWAVVCDDVDQEINLVIRGLDLWPTTKRYLSLWTSIAPHKPRPIFLHHPLILDENGQKISKSGLAKPLRDWRREGLSQTRLLAMAFHSIGWFRDRQEIQISELASLLPAVMPRPLP